jgi:hypothetical protein
MIIKNFLKNIHIIISYTILLLCFLFFLVATYWYLQDQTVLEYINSPFPLEKKEYYIGEPIRYDVKWCKYKELPAEVQLRLQAISENRVITNYTLESFTSTNVGIGCDFRTVASINIPDYIKEGFYKIEHTVIYQINPLKKEIVNGETDLFLIRR